MKIHLKERAKRFYGNQHVKRYFRNPVRKYVINPTVKATKVTLFLIAAAYIFILVGHILNSAYGEDKAQASETATSTSATSTPMTKATWHEIYENYPFPPYMAKEPNGELGMAYRALDTEAQTLESLWEKGEIRLSSEQINNKLHALKEMSLLKSRITSTLEKFRTIAPPPRTEPLKE